MKLPRFPDKGESSKRVFQRLYRVRVPRSLTVTKAEIELYGQRMSGIRDLDKYLSNELVTGRIPTTRMASIFHDGGSIQFCNVFDSKQCYLDLYQHILNWRYILESQYNVKPPPQEDFEKLQDLLHGLEAYAGILDRENKNAISSPLNVLTIGNTHRKVTPTRIPLVQVEDRSVEYVEISNYDDLLARSRR